jgi:predicted metal-binding membrane protein
VGCSWGRVATTTSWRPEAIASQRENRARLWSKSPILSATVLALAGVYQLSPLKRACLTQCRGPVQFLTRYWRPGRIGAFVMGIQHGAFCVGCCWALMLLMFAVGTANLAWMLLLGAVMAIEKNARWGKKLVRPLGIVLITWGISIPVLMLLNVR